MVYHNYSERLYLAKGEENIYVDVLQLLLHQIEGIRFLYKQFTKKKPGVILNDPTGSGKTHQVALFLNAIKHLLKQPILILCGAHEKKHWLTHFQELTDFGNGVLLEPSNLNTKKMLVCVDTRSNLVSLVSRQWSIIVIDDDSGINEVLKKGFKTDFKIWMTSVDMMSNLEVFWSIYGWLCPKEKEMAQGIVSKTEETKNKLAKLILIDAVMEDVVLRRVNGLSPFTKQTRVAGMEIKVTTKSKDVSGTKIKRSKIQSNVEKPSISNVSDLPVQSIFHNVDTKSQNDDINVEINQADNDQNRQEPMITDKNTVASKIVTEQDISVQDEPKADDNLHVLNESKNIDVSIHETPMCVENIEKKNINSLHKNIEETMRQMEEKALKKFKGSVLDTIF